MTQETRHFHEAGYTSPGRVKETAEDYRYFPEPDLEPVAPSRELVERLRLTIPELPWLSRKRIQQEWGVSDEVMRDLVNAGAVDLVIETVKHGAPSEQARAWWGNFLVQKANEANIGLDELNISPAQVAAVIALVAERTTGAVKEISVSAEPKVKTVIPVDPSGDGGLMDIVLSPTYQQDRLMYAYVSTPTDNRVIRVADGDIPKDILTGIPKGATGNTGALMFTSPTTLVVLTGDAGNPALAADPKSLAGKVLRIEQPTTVGQAPPTTALSGVGSGGGLCTDPVDGSLYVADRTPTADRLQRITKTSDVSTVWTWPDKPGVAGCAAMDGTVLVNLINTKMTVAVRLAPNTGAVTGEPDVVRKDTHAHAWALRMSPDGNVWGATVNKTAGDAEKLDDVVFPLFPQGGGFPRNNDDKT
ncbi:PQQ-dependent sugar dehydrogenase [Mycobacterium avium]|uniref:PQQ-dependent sugar dehydrogenase n=7 Tax=Mycobacterium avium TaxID=1764 RepID=UPI001E5390CD|nr:PQQ-dependent sugar dehydrogenase [Mycobacterium avium]